MSGEKCKTFNPDYCSNDDYIKNNIANRKFHDSFYDDKSRKFCKINIDGIEYESHKAASLAIGCSVTTIQKHAKRVAASGRSEIEIEIAIKKTFVFKKVDDD